MCYEVVSKEAFMVKHCLDIYRDIRSKGCNKAVDAFLSTLKPNAIGLKNINFDDNNFD